MKKVKGYNENDLFFVFIILNFFLYHHAGQARQNFLFYNTLKTKPNQFCNSLLLQIKAKR